MSRKKDRRSARTKALILVVVLPCCDTWLSAAVWQLKGATAGVADTQWSACQRVTNLVQIITTLLLCS